MKHECRDHNCAGNIKLERTDNFNCGRSLVVHHAVLGKIGIFHFELSLLFPRKFARNSYKFSFR